MLSFLGICRIKGYFFPPLSSHTEGDEGVGDVGIFDSLTILLTLGECLDEGYGWILNGSHDGDLISSIDNFCFGTKNMIFFLQTK